MKIYCGTGNRGKLREFQLAAEAAGIEIAAIPELASLPACVEDGATFAENASIKARYYAAYAPGPVFADDSGLEVDALGGAPGVFSARYAGPHATDGENNRVLLDRLREVTNRAARFVCAIALVEAGEVRGLYTGSVEGIIIQEPRGGGGFGYDPLFYYPPFGRTFGEASEEEKLLVSHRGQAFARMLEALRCGAV